MAVNAETRTSTQERDLDDAGHTGAGTQDNEYAVTILTSAEDVKRTGPEAQRNGTGSALRRGASTA